MGFRPIRRSASTNSCQAENVAAFPTPTSPSLIKVPVVLDAFNIQIPMHANIDLPADVLEIKDIKKRVFLDQCKLLSNATTPTNQTNDTGKLYISGFVRKNIRYAINPTVFGDDNQLNSGIRSLTVNVPFDCVADVELQTAPVVGPFLNNRQEWEYAISRDLPDGYPEKDSLMGTDLSQFHQEATQYFNELPYCELNRAHILQIDESLNRQPVTNAAGDEVLGEGTFTAISEKMVLDLDITLLQKQVVNRN
ncbi:CsxC family protein [Pseudalkalibacillus hwajinpoensis]|uniref:CsxC family protein n=1 Tax=Guptibacillus hwajinpoensis TaxID=208199 RepID=UPI001CFEA22B|nr:DUF3794 domain-containing protein [Pseudalkalibacillus hwajinpoensis]